MQIVVPVLMQKENSIECGVICAKMILEFYGIPVDNNELRDYFKFYGDGISMPQIGTYLMQRNFRVTIITINPLIFSLDQKGLRDKDQLIRHLEQRMEKSSERLRTTISYLIAFLQQGGLIDVKIPSVSDVKHEIDLNRPLISLLTSNFLNGIVNFNFHFHVITGYDDKFLFVNDPLPGINGGKNKYDIQDYFYGIYASAFGDADNASLMTIEKIRE